MARRTPTYSALRFPSRLISIIAGLLVCMAGTFPASAIADEPPVDLQVLSLTDLHGYLSAGENLTIRGPEGRLKVGGAGYLKAHIDDLTGQAAHSLLIGSGISSRGGPTTPRVSPMSRRSKWSMPWGWTSMWPATTSSTGSCRSCGGWSRAPARVSRASRAATATPRVRCSTHRLWLSRGQYRRSPQPAVRPALLLGDHSPDGGRQ